MKKVMIICWGLIAVGILLILNNVLTNNSVQTATIPEELNTEQAVEATTQEDIETFLVPADLNSDMAEETFTTSEEALIIPAELEYILESKEEVDGYVVETYREHEIYKDATGNVIKSVPTSNYEYLKYKQ